MCIADHTSSPKKRKATGTQQAAPPPTSLPQYTSPPFSQTGSSISTPSSRRRGHSRQRSDMSARGLDSYGRPLSRHRHTDAAYSQGLNSPMHPHAPEQHSQSAATSSEPQRRSGGSHPVSSLLEQSDSRPQSHTQQMQRDPQYSAGPERRHEGRRSTPEEERLRKGSAIKRDEARD